MLNNKLINNPKLVTAFTILISIIFLGKAFINLLNYGTDFETSYTLSKSFWNGVDVFTMEKKNPFYPHIWYILLFPFKYLEYKTVKIIFFFINLFFLFGSIFILKKNYNLNLFQTKVLVILSVTSTPLTNLLGVGNLSLFSLFFILVFYFYKSSFLRGLAISFALIKYNISIFFIIYLIIFKHYKTGIIFIFINFVSILFYFYYLDITNIFQIFDPVKSVFATINNQIDIGTVGVNSGLFNLHNFLIILDMANYYYYIFILLIFYSIYLMKFRINSKEKVFIFLLYSTACLIYHQLYDFVILIPVLAYILKSKPNMKFFNFHFFVIIYIFYFYKINTIFNFPISKDAYSIMGMILLILSNYLIVFKEKKTMLN
jgi:hypothetical protein